MCAEPIRLGDRVWFWDQGQVGHKSSGTVIKLNEISKMMVIHLDGYEGKVTMTCEMRDNKWYAYRSYQDYLDQVFKE